MKYLTKEWYLTAQHCKDHWRLTPTERAADFSEEYFQELYLAAENEFLARRLSLCQIQKKVFDPEKEKLEHHSYFVEHIEGLKFIYPPIILGMVADLRVLALGYATFEVIDAIEQFCLLNRKLVKSVSDRFSIEMENHWSRNRPAFFYNPSFHDFKVLSLKTQGNDAILSFHNGVICRFKNARILKQDSTLINAIWLYEERYLIPNGYEVHALMDNGKEHDFMPDDYSDLILQCHDIEIVTPWND